MKKTIIGFLLILLVGIWSVFGVYYVNYKDIVSVKLDSRDVLNYSHEELLDELRSMGFTYITSKRINDLNSEEKDLINSIGEVTINGDSTFKKGDTYARNVHIVVSYHTLKMSLVPYSNSKAVGKDYETVRKDFEEAGFENVKLKKQEDLIIGLLTKNGEVESVTVNGVYNYDTEEEYNSDVEVVITYHTYKYKI